ncbi:sensor histidine kinase [Streptomyces litchfieldiae]|uniref:histidine kinase n=1 Tax=Streptomyces litchfieldiae TaxID=3075543 RepID=A0ABU2MZY4_9ACTN|nr:sensor histidine kinase [Streptomyces sp. DSM 44938]MDT0347194.1 sensor histidine kinase [Streptomyces sp. DSM 44938]
MTAHPPGPGRPGGPPWQRWLTAPPRAARLPWPTSGAVLFVQMVGTQFAAHNQPDRIQLDPFARVLLVLGPLLLLLRHRHPPQVAVAVAAVVLLYLGAGYPYGPVFLSVVVGAFSAVATGHRRAAWSAMGLLWSGQLLVGHWLYRWLPPGDDGPTEWASDAAMAAWAVAVLAVAELVRIRRESLARERAAQEEAERRRADEERLRIARELHDVLAHSISVINVQAGVGLALLDTDPDQARTALTTIKAASKEALGEVRQVLDTLRAPGAAPRAPAPGLDRLPELADQAGRAGLAVTTHTQGTPAPLPPGADLAAFRIVQEALTNIVRHSGSRTARVLLRYSPDLLELRVDDDGPATGEGSGGGNGLVGMRERAAAFGGTVEAGPRPGGGFRVTARLPLTDKETP